MARNFQKKIETNTYFSDLTGLLSRMQALNHMNNSKYAKRMVGGSKLPVTHRHFPPKFQVNGASFVSAYFDLRTWQECELRMGFLIDSLSSPSPKFRRGDYNGRAHSYVRSW